MKNYCRLCQVDTPHRIKGTREQSIICNKCDASNPAVTLVRDWDGKTIPGSKVEFVEWNENKRFKQLHEEPVVGYSCIIDPQYIAYGWLTTTITEIESDTIDDDLRCIVFKTENSNYKLYIVKQ